MPRIGFLGMAVAVLTLLGLTGCASSDLSKNDNTASEVAIALPPGTGTPVQILRAIWFPGASGYGSVDSTIAHESGVLVLADDKLWFLSWDGDEKHYDMDHSIDVTTVAGLKTSRLGASLMLVVQAHNLASDGFTLMGTANIQSDPTITTDLLAKLKAIRAAHPDKEY